MAFPIDIPSLSSAGAGLPLADFDLSSAMLLAGLVVLPVSFLLLLAKMAGAATPHPPAFPFFCAFGTVGGYLLLIAFASPAAMLVAIPFIPLSALSLVASLFLLARARPFTGYHRGAAISCGIILTSVVLLFTLTAIFSRQ